MAARGVMDGEKVLEEIGPDELDRIKANAFLIFEALFPSMALPKEEVSSLAERQLIICRRWSHSSSYDEGVIRELFDRIIQEMEYRWNQDERFRPSTSKQGGIKSATATNGMPPGNLNKEAQSDPQRYAFLDL